MDNFRYHLPAPIRTRASGNRRALFVLLNPASKDEGEPHPTRNCCAEFAARAKCGWFDTRNLFAWQERDTNKLIALIKARGAELIGPDNDRHISDGVEWALAGDGAVICAWTKHGKLLDRDRAVM